MHSGLTHQNIPEFLLEKGIKPSVTRKSIFEYLAAHPMHPTADEIYRGLLKELPTLSKTTVYNTLKLFVEAGIARSITIEDNEVRYEAAMDFHGHFKCDRCGKIYDFEVSVHLDSPEELKGSVIREQNVYYKGLCRYCNEQADKK